MTIVPFSVSQNASPPFSASIIMDGAPVTLQVFWNIAAQRWYASLTTSAGDTLWTGALVGSPDDANLYLASGVFETSTLLYRESLNSFVTSP